MIAGSDFEPDDVLYKLIDIGLWKPVEGLAIRSMIISIISNRASRRS